MSITTSIAEKLTRGIVSDLVVAGDDFDPGFPTPDLNNVYQGQSGEFVTTIAYDSDGGNFNGSFELYVISHDQSVRGIIGHTDDFQAAATVQDWQVRIHTDDRLRFSIRDGDSGGALTHVFLDCPTGQWLNVGFVYREDTGIMSLRVDLESTELSVPNRIPADSPVPYLILGAPTRAFAVNCQFSDARLNQVLAFTQPRFNGADQYATFPDWTPDSANWTVTYQTDNEDGFIGLESPSFPLSEFGRVGANYHSGSLRKVELKSGHPMQGIRPMFGSIADARYASIPRFQSDGDFEVEFWYIVGFGSAADTVRIMGDADARIFISDPNSADYGRLTIRFAGGQNRFWNDAITQPAGEKVHVRITREGLDLRLSVNGVPQDLRTLPEVQPFAVEQILAYSSAGFTDSTVAYLMLVALDTGETRIYNNTDDINSELMDSGPDAQHGTWINGDDSDRVVLPITDRIYKMDEGSGDTFTDSSGGGNHAIMQNGTVWEQGSDLHTYWPCAEGVGLVMKDYVAQDIGGDTNGTLSSEVLHNTRRQDNAYPNPDWVGGYPPDNHSLLFNTATGRMNDNGDGTFNFESNFDAASGRNVLGWSLATAALEIGQRYRLEYTVQKIGSGNYSAALNVGNPANVTLHEADTSAVGDTTKTIYAEFTPAAGYDAGIRIGCGTTTDNTAHLIYSKPRITRA